MSEFKPCPFCGNEHIQLLGNALCEIYGSKMANSNVLNLNNVEELSHDISI